MSEVKLKMSIPLDEDGYVRRECPHCQQQFKWHHTEGPAPAVLPNYFCPLCGVSAPPNAWWTTAQAKHAEAVMRKEVVQPMMRDFQAQMRRLNRPGGSIRVTTRSGHYPPPQPLPPEPNDMRIVVPTCHPEEPIKVPDERNAPVHCLICGQLTEVNES